MGQEPVSEQVTARHPCLIVHAQAFRLHVTCGGRWRCLMAILLIETFTRVRVTTATRVQVVTCTLH